MIQEPDWNSYRILSAVPKDIRAEIGSIVIFQGSIEFELRACISLLIRVNSDAVEMISAELSYKQLIALVSSLMIQKVGKDSELYKEFSQAIAKLDEFEMLRNRVAHSHWSHSIDAMALQNQAARHKSTSKRGQGIQKVTEEVTLTELQIAHKKAVFYLGQLILRVQQASTN